ncbi:MAG: hypothetical protein M0Z79_05935 [Nitrospiraceae bacterium]|nr:hypothetical protein [Nitrospiraceae bacterium]
MENIKRLTVMMIFLLLLLISSCSTSRIVTAPDVIVEPRPAQIIEPLPETISEHRPEERPILSSPPPASVQNPKLVPMVSRIPASEQIVKASPSGSYGHVGYVTRPSRMVQTRQISKINVDGYTKSIEDQLKNLEIGQILFNPAEKMTVGIKEIIEVRIAKQISDQFTKGLSGRGVPQIEQIKVGTFMKAHLYGGNFDIKLRSNSEEQTISNEGFTPWEWDVTPQQGGPQTLLLTVTVRLKLPDGREETKDYPVFRRPIIVAVNRAYTTKAFIMKYWQWLITSIIIPFIGWFAKRKWDSKP